MKRKIKNGINMLIILILLFATIPSGVMAEDISTVDENVLLETSTTTQAETEVSVSFTPNCLADFKVNDLTAKRSGDDVIFTLNYESTREGGYSFFNPPNGDAIMKYDFSGIKIGTNSVEIKLTLLEFKQVISKDGISMKFWVDSDASASWIYFKTAQLSSLASQDGIDNPPAEILPTAITLDKTSINLTVDASEKITPSLSPSNTTKTTVTWSSSSSNIATVDSNGNVKGIKEGTALITATTSNNLTAKCTVTVKKSTVINADPSISYQTHVQDVGWQDLKYNGGMSGTSGRSLRLEGIKIQLNNYENLGVTYQTHIQNIGWEADTNRGWKSNGAMSGTEGLSYRLEAIQIKLTGTNAENYDIYYQVHAQNVGWMGWAKNGESAGTAGYGYRLEGIQIKVVPKGDPVPSDNVSYPNPFKENIEAPYSQILQEYRVAEANGFYYEVIKTLPNVNTELAGNSYSKSKLYYMVEDISGDSIPELVIASYRPNSSFNKYQIYDIYRLDNGKPSRIFDVYSMGYRNIYTICENQIIELYGDGGTSVHGVTFFKLDENSTLTCQHILYDKPYYYLTDPKNAKQKISKEKADEIINSYKPKGDINWIKL